MGVDRKARTCSQCRVFCLASPDKIHPNIVEALLQPDMDTKVAYWCSRCRKVYCGSCCLPDPGSETLTRKKCPVCGQTVDFARESRWELEALAVGDIFVGPSMPAEELAGSPVLKKEVRPMPPEMDEKKQSRKSGRAFRSKTKQCELCAERIPLEAEHCPYCPAVYTVTIQGYCQECHAVRATSAEGHCLKCGGKVTDLQIQSTFAGEVTSPKPVPQVSKLTAQPKPVPVIQASLSSEAQRAPLKQAAQEVTQTVVPKVGAADERRSGRRMPRWAWALIAGGIVLVLGVAAGLTVWALHGRGSLAQYDHWRMVFSDTFDSNSNRWHIQGWYDETGHGTMGIANGSLHIQAWSNGAYANTVKIPYMANVGEFLLSVDVKQVGGSRTGDASSIGVVFHYLSDFAYFYIFEIRPNRQANLAIVRHGEYQIIDGPYEVPSYQPGEFNHIAIVYESSTIKVYVNDELVISKMDDSLPTGRLAMQWWLQYYNDYADYYIDNLEIRVP
jgi:hypothetical protein